MNPIADELYVELDDAARAEVDGKRRNGASSAAPKPRGDGPFDRANAVPIADVCRALGIEVDGDFATCPCGAERLAASLKHANGLKCSHKRCEQRGKAKGFRTPVDLVMEVRSIGNKEAVLWLAERFHFEADFGKKKDADTKVASARILYGEALSEPLPPLDYLVPQIGLVAGPGAPHEIVGYAFSAKTVTAQQLLLALATGKPVWGAYSVPPRRVAHVDLEQGERLDIHRYQRLARQMDVDLASLGDALALVVMPQWKLVPECADHWLGVMRGRDLIVIDSLRGALPNGVDENASEVRNHIDLLGAWSEQTGCRALLLHHARKPSNDESASKFTVRGSSAIFDAADSVYILSAEKGEPVRVEHVKARSHGEPVEDFALVVSDVEIDGDARAGLRVQVHGAELVQERREAKGAAAKAERTARDAAAIRRVLSTRPGLGSRELRAATSLSGDRVAAALVHLGDDVEARDEVQGRSRTTRHYLRRSE